MELMFSSVRLLRTELSRPRAYVLSRAETFLPRWRCADLGLLRGIPSGYLDSPKGIDSSAQGKALGDGTRSKHKVDRYDELCTRPIELLSPSPEALFSELRSISSQLIQSLLPPAAQRAGLSAASTMMRRVSYC